MQLSIIIPTYNERDNVETMVMRIASSLQSVTDDYEIWFIDDSTDDTPEILSRLSNHNRYVHFIHRTGSAGLASAVVRGFGVSSGRYIVVMDGDLQHPPELLPVIFERLREGNDVVIPSRFVEGGSDGGLNAVRKLISWTARKFGQIALRNLRQISDCTSGYFGMHRVVIQKTSLNPIGWKILIEILARGCYRTVHEIPYVFQARDAGLSKMSFAEQLNYIRHIFNLMFQSAEDRRLFYFCIVGLSGVAVNIAALSCLVYLYRFPKVVSSLIANFIAMLNNFMWNDQITWRNRDHKKNASAVRLPLFIGVSVVGIAITTSIMVILRLAHIPVLVGQCVGIGIATYWNFTANNRWTWKRTEKISSNSGQAIIVTREAKSEGNKSVL